MIVSGVAHRPDTGVSCARAVAPKHSRATARLSMRRIDLQYTREKAGQVLVGPDRPPRGCPSCERYAFEALDRTLKSSLDPSAAASTSISSPRENSPRRIFSESGSSMYFWID